MADRTKSGDDPQDPTGPEPTELHRENIPGSLDHASGEVEEFEASLVSGAGSEPSDDGDVDADDRELARSGGRRTAHTPKGGPRFLQFLRASWAELQRVQWPDRRQVFQATSVVVGFVIVAGAYLGVADWLAQKVVNFII
jgi:preprotein translocase subunit SecE